MGHQNALGSGSIIDTASMLFGRTPLPPSTSATKSQQAAMQRRLSQLNAALGEPEAPQATVSALQSQAAGNNQGLLFTSLFLTALVAAMAGARYLSLPEAPANTPIQSTPAVVVVPPMPVAAQPAISDEKQVGDQLESWRSAWVQRDIDAYLGTYSQTFAPADGSSRDAWVAARTRKLASGAPITIELHDLLLEKVDSDHFKASFLQDYASGNYRETARAKTLTFAREGGEWRITGEWQR